MIAARSLILTQQQFPCGKPEVTGSAISDFLGTKQTTQRNILLVV